VSYKTAYQDEEQQNQEVSLRISRDIAQNQQFKRKSMQDQKPLNLIREVTDASYIEENTDNNHK
jgi:hypothetical protein